MRLVAFLVDPVCGDEEWGGEEEECGCREFHLGGMVLCLVRVFGGGWCLCLTLHSKDDGFCVCETEE